MFTQLVRLTFDREGIAYFCSDADSSLAGLAAPMAAGQSRIYITDDSDWSRAVDLMREIGAPAENVAHRPITARKHPAWVTIAATLAVLLVLWVVIAR